MVNTDNYTVAGLYGIDGYHTMPVNFSLPVKVEPGDTFQAETRGDTMRVRIVRYEDALLQPEYEVFI